jgi:uncharacterized metal-binding protein
MSPTKNKVVVLACSGIGKTYGAVAREIVYEIIERVRPGIAVTTCLPLLVIEDPDARQLITDNPVITIDGCPKSCAEKSVQSLGVSVAKACQVLSIYKNHKELKPDGISELNDAGKKLAAVAADELAQTIDELAAKGVEK